MVLLIDNSNTRTKFMRSSGGVLLAEQRCVRTAQLTPESIRLALEGWQFERVLLCSVVPRTAFLFQNYFTCPLFRVSPALVRSLNFDYDGLETLGADRVANAVASAARGIFPCVTMDLGTATNMEVITVRCGKPCFVGGCIAPGFGAYASILSQSTALLPEVPRQLPSRGVGRDTTESMQLGVMIGYRGVIHEILESISQELGSRPYVYATGGDARLVSSLVKEIDEIVPLLTFEGLNLMVHDISVM